MSHVATNQEMRGNVDEVLPDIEVGSCGSVGREGDPSERTLQASKNPLQLFEQKQESTEYGKMTKLMLKY
jgi:hypothetical protein